MYYILDSRVSNQIFLLGQMLPPTGRAILKQKHWKFSVQECVDSIIIHVNVSRLKM